MTRLILAALVLAVLLAPALPVDPLTQDRMSALAAPSATHWLGTDALGRDVLARTLAATRLSLLAAALGAAAALALGLLFGGLAGFHGGWPDDAIMRAAELLQALPWIYLLLGVRALLPLSLPPAQAFLVILLLLAVLGWMRPARLIRGVVLSARERDYVLAARAFGASGLYLFRRHILPALRPVLFTQGALLAARFLLAEVTLSFLGLGVADPVPSLGQMLADLRDPRVLTGCPWMLAPCVVVLAIVACIHEVGEPGPDFE